MVYDKSPVSLLEILSKYLNQTGNNTWTHTGTKKNIVYGIFNYSNEGACTWYDFATKIKEITHANCIINPIPTAAYPTPAKRPAFSLLDKTKIKETYQIKIPCRENFIGCFSCFRYDDVSYFYCLHYKCCSKS